MQGNYDHAAPSGKFRVLGVDTFEGPFEDFLIADCDDKETAINLAKSHTAEMQPCYVYDDAGKLVHASTMKQVWGVLCYAIGGGHPALTLYESQSEAEAEARKLNDSDDWTAEVKEYKLAPDAFPDSEKFPIGLRPADLLVP